MYGLSLQLLTDLSFTCKRILLTSHPIHNLISVCIQKSVQKTPRRAFMPTSVWITTDYRQRKSVVNSLGLLARSVSNSAVHDLLLLLSGVPSLSQPWLLACLGSRGNRADALGSRDKLKATHQIRPRPRDSPAAHIFYFLTSATANDYPNYFEDTF